MLVVVDVVGEADIDHVFEIIEFLYYGVVDFVFCAVGTHVVCFFCVDWSGVFVEESCRGEVVGVQIQ